MSKTLKQPASPMASAELEKALAAARADYEEHCRRRDQADAQATAAIGSDDEQYAAAKAELDRLNPLVAERMDRMNRLDQRLREAHHHEETQQIIQMRKDLWAASQNAQKRFDEIAKTTAQMKRDYEATLDRLKGEQHELHRDVESRRQAVDAALAKRGLPAFNIHSIEPPADTL